MKKKIKVKSRVMYKTFNQEHASVLAKYERDIMKVLKQAREEQELPYTELSEMAGVSPRSLSTLEQDGIMLNPVMCTVLWAEALGFELVLKKK